MAADILLKIEGVDGDSKIADHEGEIDILSVSWGASNAGSVSYGGGGGVARANISDLAVSKRADKASPTLFLKTCDGSHFESAKLTFRKAGGDAPVDYLVYEMTTVFVTSWQQSGGGDSFAMETLSLSFEKVKVTFTPQDETGAPGEPVEVEWDIAANKKP